MKNRKTVLLIFGCLFFFQFFITPKVDSATVNESILENFENLDGWTEWYYLGSGKEIEVSLSSEKVKEGRYSEKIVIKNDIGYGLSDKKYNLEQNWNAYGKVGFWICGDKSGARYILKFINSLDKIVGEYIVPVTFEGWKWVEFNKAENDWSRIIYIQQSVDRNPGIIFVDNIKLLPPSTTSSVSSALPIVKRKLPAKKPFFGIGYVTVKPWPGEQQADGIVHAKGLAEDMKTAYMNNISLIGPLIFSPKDITNDIKELVAELKKDGKLKVFFATNTFMDWGRSMKQYSFVEQDGKEIAGDYFCMVRSRESRIPELKEILKKGIDAGFDGVELDFFDWGLDNLQVCYCEKCVSTFNKANGSNYNRASLVSAINADEGGIREKWLEWKAGVRRDITKELSDFAHQYAKSKDKVFLVRLCQGGVGTELKFTANESHLDMLGPMTYGSIVGGTITSYDVIYKIYQQDREEMEKSKGAPTLIAFLNAGWTDPPPYKTPINEMHSLATAAMKGGADGWMFFPDKITGEEWWSLKRTVIESKIIYAEQFEMNIEAKDITNLISKAKISLENENYSFANNTIDQAIQLLRHLQVSD